MFTKAVVELCRLAARLCVQAAGRFYFQAQRKVGHRIFDHSIPLDTEYARQSFPVRSLVEPALCMVVLLQPVSGPGNWVITLACRAMCCSDLTKLQQSRERRQVQLGDAFSFAQEVSAH